MTNLVDDDLNHQSLRPTVLAFTTRVKSKRFFTEVGLAYRLSMFIPESENIIPNAFANSECRSSLIFVVTSKEMDRFLKQERKRLIQQSCTAAIMEHCENEKETKKKLFS